MNFRPFVIASVLVSPFLTAMPEARAEKLSGRGHVAIKKTEAGYQMLRDGQPVVVRGVCGHERLELAASIGANSLRTYGSENARQILNQAQQSGMTVSLGVWLEHTKAPYKDEKYKNRIRQEVRTLVGMAREHPATLLYSFGNEINSGADDPEAWAFVNELAGIAHKLDPNHPVMTVLAGAPRETLNRIAKHAPALDLIGMNSYGGVASLQGEVAGSEYKGPYMVTEWGTLGHWEVGKTAWGVPIEPDSQKKAGFYRRFAEVVASDKQRCLGSYVFLWGQKEERTPTWYGMFLENRPQLGLHGESCASVDVMAEVWSGKRPANTAPGIDSVTVDGRREVSNLTVPPSNPFRVKVGAVDAEGDALSYVWEVLGEAERLGEGGSHEERPRQIAGALKVTAPGEAEVRVGVAGRYRVYAYVLDGKGHAATVNIPFLVK